MQYEEFNSDLERGSQTAPTVAVKPPKIVPEQLQKRLAEAQLVMAVLIVLIETMVIMFDIMPTGPTGILAGVMFGCTGGMGILNVITPGRCSTVSFMVLSILSVVMVILLLAIDIESMMRSHNCTAGKKSFFCDEFAYSYAAAAAIMSSFSCLVAVCEAVVALLSVVLCMWMVCCTSNTTSSTQSMWVQVQQPPN